MTLRSLVTLAAVLAALAVAAPSAVAKEDVVARVLTPVSRDAEPGRKVTVVWTLTVLDDGVRRPFGGGYVLVRLFGPDGSRTPLAYGISTATPARYRATVRVPRGGVARVRIGIMGTACAASGCRPAPTYFRIVGRVFR